MSTMATEKVLAVRELDHRFSDGMDVWLLWDPQTNAVSVTVADGRTGQQLEIPAVPPADALEAFQHPFGYAVKVGCL